MRKFVKYCLSVCFVLLLGGGMGSAYGQVTVSQLQEQIKKAEEEIKINTELLSKTQKDQKLNQSQLKIIRSRISQRKEVVLSLEKQIKLIETEVRQKEGEIDDMNGQLERIKEEYAKIVRATYKNYKLNNFTLFLFASDDFNDAIRRIEYMKRYNKVRKERAEQVKSVSHSVALEVAGLNNQKEKLTGVRVNHSKELTALGGDEIGYKKSVNKLIVESKKLNQTLKTNRETVERAQKRIQQIVAEEARKSSSQTRTPEEERYLAEISGKFDQNKGKLLYPISRGVIIDRYGEHSHPTHAGLKINNKGVNIAGGAGSEVRSVFEGSVTRIFSIPGMNNCVMLRHGNYITLYANMDRVDVKMGDYVTINHKLGNIANSSNSDDNYLHFEIWKETTNLNPEQWLRR